MSGIVSAIFHVDFVIQDMDRMVAFYTRTLGFELIEDCVVDSDAALFISQGKTRKMRMAFLSLNKRSPMVELMQLLDERGDPMSASSTSKVMWTTFLVNNMDEAKQQMSEAGLRPVTDEYTIALKKLGGARTILFRDPEGYLIELVGPK